MNKLALLIVILLALPSVVMAAEDDITLLSVLEYDDGTQVGGTAIFHLETKPGSGKVFLESYPAAKVDLQVATRLANEYACEYSDVNCNQYDFFYTIRSQSPLIGGSSGGGAATVLTLAVLEDTPIRDSVAMTGAITSGGILTPVAGVKEKIQAAQDEDYEVVIIPELVVQNKSNGTNTTRITSQTLENFSIEIQQHINIRQSYATATGKTIETKSTDIQAPPYYVRTMSETATRLCSRMSSLFDRVDARNTSNYESALEFKNKSQQHNDVPYARASYCFSANLQLQELQLQNYSNALLAENAGRLKQSITSYKDQVEQVPLSSFTDLETYAIVVERLLEAQTILEDLNYSNVSRANLGYAIERYESAQAWSSFFGVDTQEVDINPSDTRQACLEQLRAVETRKSYLASLLPPSYLTTVEEELSKAYEYSNDQEYTLCLFKATKAKAHANMFFTTLTLQQDQLSTVASVKQQESYNVIAQQHPVFPLLGYSYVTYAETFNESDYSALLFAEYGLVFSDVSGYFPPKSRPIFELVFTENQDWIYFTSGLILGCLATLFVLLMRKKP